MKKFKYKKIDAFTSGTSLGNPAAYLNLENEILTESEMLSIAKEHKGFVSEVVYVMKSKIADCKLVYYSSECEVDFCGHGTIASMYDLIKNSPALLQKEEIVIETNRKGLLTIYNEIERENTIYITAPEPQYLKVPITKKECASVLKIDEKTISSKYDLAFIDAGLKTLIIPIDKYKDEISIYPTESELKDFCLKDGIDIILIFSKETDNKNCIAHTRVFAPKFGYLEDPATGSGNSAFGYYMLKSSLWNGEACSIEQGGDNKIFNIIKLSMKDHMVLFGGKATVKIDGEYIL